MQLFITIVHVLLSLALILIILLQPGKEGAAVFGGGGGGNQMYGPRGQANFLGRATTVVAALFMVTSITLAYRSSERTQAGTGGIEDAILEMDLEDQAPAPSIAPPTPTRPAVPVPAAPAADEPSPDQTGSNTENLDGDAAPGDAAPPEPAPEGDPSPEVDTPEEGQ